MRRVLPPLITALLLTASLLGVRNVFGDHKYVDALAESVACGGAGPACRARIVRFERTPFFQEMQISVGKKHLDVTCRRAWIFLGDYSCSAK